MSDSGKRGLRAPLGPRIWHLCVDMQKLFGPGAPWATPWLEKVRPVVFGLCQAHPERTIFTRFIPPYRPDAAPGTWRDFYAHWSDVTRDHLAPEFLELLPELARLAPPAVVLDKPAYSPFFETDLDDQLRRRQVDGLIFTGTETDVCVLAGVLDAVDRGYRVIIVGDGVCSSSDATHDALMSLYHRRFRHQIEVADAAEVMAAWA